MALSPNARGAGSSKVKKPTLFDDFREVKENWHDPEYRRGFVIGFGPAFLKGFLICGFMGLLIGYALSR